MEETAQGTEDVCFPRYSFKENASFSAMKMYFIAIQKEKPDSSIDESGFILHEIRRLFKEERINKGKSGKVRTQNGPENNINSFSFVDDPGAKSALPGHAAFFEDTAGTRIAHVMLCFNSV